MGRTLVVKWMSLVGVMGAVLLAPAVAKAAVMKGKLVGFVVNDTPEACATSIEVTQSNGGLTDGTEKLSFGLSYSYTFASGKFDPAAGSFGVGARVLYASPSFVSQTGAKADITIPDADCKDFGKTGGDLRFSGSLGMYPNIVDVKIPADFGTRRAYDGSRFYDLRSEPFSFGGYGGGKWTIGGAGGGMTSGNLPGGGMTSGGTTSGGPAGSDPTADTGDGSGGCAIAGTSSSSSTPALVPIFALAALVALRRRR